jgi:hypothetical protein
LFSHCTSIIDTIDIDTITASSCRRRCVATTVATVAGLGTVLVLVPVTGLDLILIIAALFVGIVLVLVV